MEMNAFEILAKEGVATPSDMRNHFSELATLQRKGLVAKRRKGARVFYELTEASLGLLDAYRKVLLHTAQVESLLHPRNQQLKALLEDLRFLNPNAEIASKYKFLGDWQLKHDVLLNHLKLARLKFYEQS